MVQQTFTVCLAVNVLFQKHSSLLCTYPVYQCRGEAWHRNNVHTFGARTRTLGFRGEGSEAAAAGTSGRWGLLWGLPAAPLGPTAGGERRWQPG